MNRSSNIDEKAKVLVVAARLDPTNTLPIIQLWRPLSSRQRFPFWSAR